ncbi:putative membrane protein [Cytobacillus eiseniae]|uniref:Membrane protein n=1 Tax=Cytobacillus eiseniae TaxID=762947 RepID=A0ABS4RH76_9BACI|nr:DUF2207 domain-containing protein [Cytobacillus eiseniae]MBP2242242.1 putative membrane protein [Cytobacillus eiseniae]
MYRKIITVLFLAIILLIPTQALAVDYDITDVEIHAYLQEDGRVAVQEQHTYEFSGKFGGIIREIIPKKGSEIVNLEAYEGKKQLEIETDKSEHRIHREGKDETVTIDLFYEIKNGVDVYADVAELYWPFFDKSNESTYGSLTINVYPPESTTNVIAFGYDEAFQKEQVLQDGQVQFQLGKVPSERNGDIRVAYDSKLFGAVTSPSKKHMRDEIEAAEQQLTDQAAAQSERKEQLRSIGMIVVPIFSILLLFVLLRAYLGAKGRKHALIRELGSDGRLPKQVLSLPATIYFTNYQQLLPETIAASILDLVRKGHVDQLDENRFRLVNREGLLGHEQELVSWLFDEIGANDEFNFDDLSAYTKDQENHEKYQTHRSKWQNAVRDEWKAAALYEKNGKYRWTVCLLSLILVPFSILFAANDLIALFLISLFLFLVLLVFGITYRPKNWNGAKIAYEWQLFKKRFPNMTETDWKLLSTDDRMRGYIYGLGINEKSLQVNNKSFKTTFHAEEGQVDTVYGFDPTWIILATMVTSNFKSADDATAIHTSSGSGGAGSGSGAGGGGGGSGAF